MTDRMLEDAFTVLADRAEPVDDLAERALRTAARRRVRAVTCAAAVVLAVAVPVTVVAADGPSDPGVLGPQGARHGTGLPDNTPEELRLARACLRGGAPVGSMGEKRDDLGGPSDFRLLTAMRVPGGRLAEVGSTRGYVLCATKGKTNTEPPQFHAWPGKSSGLFGFDAPLRVDGIRQVQAVSGWDELNAVVVGRAKPAVAKIKVAWEGGRTDQAAVRNGFFIAQTPTKMVPDRGVTGPMAEGAMSSPTIRVVSVTGYDADGKVLHAWRPKVKTEQAGFVPEDCTDGLTHPRPTLCD
jgi:hypothetical protein